VSSRDEIKLFAGLKRDVLRSKAGKTRYSRMVVEFKAPDLTFDAREATLARDVATAIAEHIRDSMLAGTSPGGTPLPQASAATLERRAHRVAQASRGGGAAPQFKQPAFRASARKNYVRRMRAARLGMFEPDRSAQRFGVESGMLAKSAAAAPSRDGRGGWRVFFAVARAKLDRSGQSAAGRVFARVPVWSAAAMRSPRVQSELRDLRRLLFATRAARLWREAQRAVANVQALAAELEQP
jgi:hypothetical protein